MRSLIASALIALSSLMPLMAQAQEEMQPPQPLLLNFEKHGCGRLKQDAFYRTEYHFVNICRGEANLQMVVTDNDGLGRERLPAEKQTSSGGVRYTGTSDRGIGYTIDNKTFTILFKDQGSSQEKVTRVVMTGLATIKPANTVTGTVTYRQRIALPPNATVEVTLADVSRADAAAIVIDRQTIVTKGKQVPIPFTLNYDPNTIIPNHNYAVSARILVDGQLRWVSTTRNSVITLGNPAQAEVWVSPVSQ